MDNVYRRTTFLDGKKILDMVVSVEKAGTHANINFMGRHHIVKLYKTKKGTYFNFSGCRYYLGVDVISVEYKQGEFTKGFCTYVDSVEKEQKK